jgi:hypothetical protein
MTEGVSNYLVNFEHSQDCEKVFRCLSLLKNDQYTQGQNDFSSESGRHFLTAAIEGLIVVLSCQQEGNSLSGSFYSVTSYFDIQKFLEFLKQSGAKGEVAIKEAADQGSNHFNPLGIIGI